MEYVPLSPQQHDHDKKKDDAYNNDDDDEKQQQPPLPTGVRAIPTSGAYTG